MGGNGSFANRATATEAGQTLAINKYFANAYKVYRWEGSSENLTADTMHTYSTPWTYTVVLSLSWADRWTFQNVSKPLVPKDGTTMQMVTMASMPSLAEWFGDSATSPGNNFFYFFNYNWALRYLPAWSFHTENITRVGNNFFSNFNNGWYIN